MAAQGRAVAVEDVIVISSSISDDGGEARVGEEEEVEAKARSAGGDDKNKKIKKGKDNKRKRKNKEEKKKLEKIGGNVSSSSSCSPIGVISSTTIGASCSFPMSRVWRFVRSESTATRTTPDAIFLINKASEMFLELFAEDAFANAAAEHIKSISYKNLSSSVCKSERYEFLSDFVPEKVRAEDALKAAAASAEGELVDT